MSSKKKLETDKNELLTALRAGDMRVLAKVITLFESNKEEDLELALLLSKACAKNSNKSLNIGFSGSPGVGKSTLINALGEQVLKANLRLAVIAVDPSSPVSKGSILADKTRMSALLHDKRAFVRPMPSKCILGGVAPRVYEILHVLETAGFDVVFIESVGVGQSEKDLAELSDYFLYVTQPESGDELQAMKRGILEFVDAVVVNKIDLAPKKKSAFKKTVHHVSALKGEGISELWGYLWKQQSKDAEVIKQKRAKKSLFWLHKYFEQLLFEALKKQKVYQSCTQNLDLLVKDGESVYVAANELVKQFISRIR